MLTDFQSKLESLLLVSSGPTSFKKLTDLLKAEIGDVKDAVERLSETYQSENRGWRLTITGNEVQLVTSSQNAKLVESVLKDELKEGLTPAALETLAIVAYKGPIHKTEIDFIRGVNSVYTLHSLMVRGLVERNQDAGEARGFNYSITSDFLNYLGVNKFSELPEYQEVTKKLEEVKNSEALGN